MVRIHRKGGGGSGGAVTNAGTFAVQEDGDALTALQLIDDIVHVDDTATHSTGTTKGAAIMGAATPTDGSVDANDLGVVAMSVDRRLHTDAQIVGTDAALDVSAATVTVDNGGTFAVQEDGAALTALQLIDDVVYTDDTSTHATGTSKGAGIMAAATPTDGSVGANDIGMLAMSTDRRLHVDAQIVGTDAALDVSGATVTVDGSGVTQPVSGTVTANLGAIDNAVLDDIAAAVHEEDEASANGHSGMLMLARRTATPADTSGLDGDYEVPQMDNGRLWMSATVDAALPAGDNNIGNVDIASSVALDVSAATVTVDLGANNDVTVDGSVAHDAADSGGGGPVKVGGRAQAPWAQPEEVADNDRVDLLTDLNGYLRVRGDFDPSFADINDSTSGDNTIIAAAGAGKRIAVWAIAIVSDGTTDVRWEDGAGGTAFTGQIPLQAREGYTISAGGLVPLFVGSADTLLNLELTATINVHGFVSYTVMDD